MSTIRFCADVHLGKLARLLRMLGFDTAYQNNFFKEELHEIARSEHRSLLSKSDYFSKFSDIDFFKIKNFDPDQQLKEVVEHFHLHELFNPFTRCLYCNEILEKKEKSEVENILLPETKKSFSEFWQCPSCRKIYWKGSHYERMKKWIQKFSG
jgi:uncharacterized protein with PIN domain